MWLAVIAGGRHGNRSADSGCTRAKPNVPAQVRNGCSPSKTSKDWLSRCRRSPSKGHLPVRSHQRLLHLGPKALGLVAKRLRSCPLPRSLPRLSSSKRLLLSRTDVLLLPIHGDGLFSDNAPLPNLEEPYAKIPRTPFRLRAGGYSSPWLKPEALLPHFW
jgi:hypothetical protein